MLQTASAPPPLAPTRAFGRFALRRLLGKSESTMLWLAVDTRSAAETMLMLPRAAPTGPGALGTWLLNARRAARLDHPDLVPVVECGVHEHWPFVAVDRRAGMTLDEWLLQHPHPTIDDIARWVGSVLRGLAFAHEAGVPHLDLQLHSIVVDERGGARLMGLSVALADAGAPGAVARAATAAAAPAFDPGSLRAQRLAGERDVVAAGLVLHRLLTGRPPLDEPDIGCVLGRMAPRGREGVRLPWTTPQPVAEPLRAIVDRSTSVQPRLRYRSARTFLDALTGWHEAQSEENGGPVALLIDRLRTVGHLPALPGLASRVQGVTGIESQRTDEIARHLLPDMALSFELLRTLNSAQVQGTQVPGNGPVLTLRRVVALIGVDGVRAAANSLRTWPGPLDDGGANALQRAIERVRLAGHLAQALRPAGYDAEVVYLVAALQNLGRLMLQYHFADEAEQIRQLMLPSPAQTGELPPGDQPGLGEEAAAFAVLGVDIEALGTAVARHWGLGADVLHMIRRLPTDAPVRKPDGDADLLRIVASAANEVVDALELPSGTGGANFSGMIQRYARTLRLDAKSLQAALKEARDALRRMSVTDTAAAAVHEERSLPPRPLEQEPGSRARPAV
ncbi:MAG TPA: HDOD domain-containing protein [Caldimonas sp.]|jgi:non-specific serine/threonine protein kinase|nr:HDOD domain-containing protein [Caldimonas sp.]HEX2541763.1 HDOD domain-containing protein [Caldimonas sp.]